MKRDEMPKPRDDHRNDVNIEKDCQALVVERLDAITTTQVSHEIQDMNKWAQVLKIQAAFHKSKEIG
jgi:hypothetical protein